MVARNVGFAVAFSLMAATARAQDPAAQAMPNPQAMQMQVQQIMQQRPREAEAAARAFLILVAPNLVNTLDSLKARSVSANNQPVIVIDGTPVNDRSDRSLDQYWAEVGQLTVQFDMVQNLNRRDSVRAQLVAKMFGLEANARAQQRAYRSASEANRPAIRKQIETLISQHFDLEDQLRGLEVADIERRLADVRAETQRRREKRAEFVKWAVDDIIRDATRPQ
ncbi:MAG TPA: hypothetical protein VK573_11150 [Gemmatimonadales bacterium]|nr:hypothetical protein [Gemmatimonadales bacterium]